MVVQVASQGCRVIGHDAAGPQAVGHFKIRLFIKAPEYHLSGEGGACSFQTTLPGNPPHPCIYIVGLSSVETSWRWCSGEL